MGTPQPTERSAGRRGRRAMPWIALVVLVLLLLVGLVALLHTERITRLALDQLGQALELEITAAGSEVSLRGTPTLVVHGLVARAPGAAQPLLIAERALLSLPWTTLRAGGSKLDFIRIELDAPVLDLPALQAWRETRPPREQPRIPILREGLQVENGTLVSRSWRIEALDLDTPLLHPQREMHATATGRYVNGDTSMPFDLHVVLARPVTGSALGIAGTATLMRPGWQVPADVRLSGMLHFDDGVWRISDMKLATDAQYRNDEIRAPFAFGLAAPLRYADGRLTLAPAGVALRPQGKDNPIPALDAHGALELQESLALQLDGRLADWPLAWPALPAPLGDTDEPLPFSLRYAGDTDLSDITRLQLQRGASRFEGRFRLPDISDWIGNDARMSPLPPLEGSASVPRMEIPGATLHGVTITVDSESIDSPTSDDE